MPDPEFLVDAFGLAGPGRLSQVARGAMGAVWRLDAGGSSYAAKELFWNPPDEARVAAEVDLVERCRAVGVRSQRAVGSADGGYLVRSSDGSRWWRLYEWIDGRTPERQDPATASWLVSQLGYIHRAAVPGDPYGPDDSWYHRIDADWDQLASDAAAARLPWAGQLASAVPELVELSTLVDSVPAGPAVQSHRDLNGSNAVLDTGGRLWLVDWDNHGPQEPWRELGALLTEHLRDPARLSELTSAYARAAGECAADCPDGPELFATGLAVWLNFLAGQARAVLDPESDPEHQAWSSTRVAGLIGPFPTIPELATAATLVTKTLTRA